VTASRRPTRATVEGRAYLDLQKLARSQHRPTYELHQLYALEGFLTRLAISRHADKLVLKQQLDDRLPAAFADLLATVLDFADPAISDSAAGMRWNPVARAWT
jgi:hypothetical protein